MDDFFKNLRDDPDADIESMRKIFWCLIAFCITVDNDKCHPFNIHCLMLFFCKIVAIIIKSKIIQVSVVYDLPLRIDKSVGRKNDNKINTVMLLQR